MTSSDRDSLDRLHPREAFDELGGLVVSGGQPIESVLDTLVALAGRVLPRPVEASVTLVRGDKAATAAFTSDRARNLDERQYSQGHGPCLDSASAGALVVISDMADEKRWPAFAEVALANGIGSSMAVPLPVQRQVTGALNIYSPRPNAFDADAIELAETFAAHAAVAVAHAELFETAVALASQMREAMATRATIEQAKGIVMRERGCTPDQAFETLVRMSQEGHVKLRELSQRMVEHMSREVVDD